MTAQVLDGEAVAARVRLEVAERVRRLRESGVVPGLGTILVGDDAPSVRMSLSSTLTPPRWASSRITSTSTPECHRAICTR